ncbi:hypothetical protein ECP03018678_3188 [Escherichia coli P0301867.8]|nr:hypothetical protein ECP03018678_3188 [Escherichia coli P0301867.8]
MRSTGTSAPLSGTLLPPAHLQFAFLVNGGEIRQTTFLDNLPAVTVYNSARRRTAVVHILVPPIQRGIQASMYSLVPPA